MPEVIRSPEHKYWCKHFVSIAHLSHEDRREAGRWALDRFVPVDIDVWTPRGSEAGFWFANEHDVLIFTLRWSAK